MIQLRIGPKAPSDTAPGDYLYSIVDVVNGKVLETLEGGGDSNLQNALREGGAALTRILAGLEPPVRHEFECICGSRLSVEARRSRKDPYSWDRPRQVVCICTQSYGIKITFTAGMKVPRIEEIAQSPIT